MTIDPHAIDNRYDLDLSVPRLSEYFGLWCVQPEPFLAAVERCQGMDLPQHVAEVRAAGGPQNKPQTDYAMLTSGVAMITARGPLMKFVGSMADGTSTVRMRRAVRQAAADPDVRSILMLIDSPGGTVSGTQDLAEDVARAAKAKPLVAYIEDLGASAAYWVASQARKVYANASALVGSIGTYAVIQDLSGAAARLGVKVHVIRSGEHKGAGTPGTEVTPAQLAEWQRVVDALNEHFLAGVSAGRRMSADRVRALADGRVHVGQAAADLGLVDAIRSLDAVLAELSDPRSSGARTMAIVSTAADQAAIQPASATASAASVPPPLPHQSAAAQAVALTVEQRPQPADYQQLRAACPGADAEFICRQLEGRVTAAEATAAWIAEQARRLEEARQASAAAQRARGVEPVGTRAAAAVSDEAGESADPIARYDALVRQRIAGGQSRLEACRGVAQADPQLHQAFLLATNSGKKAQRLIREKFE